MMPEIFTPGPIHLVGLAVWLGMVLIMLVRDRWENERYERMNRILDPYA